MTNLLIRLFVKDYTHTEKPAVRADFGRLSGLTGILCNLLLFCGKLAVGTLSGSVSVTADAINNLSDASSSVISLIGFKMAEKPADADHPYGHARYEYLSGLMVSVLVLLIGVELLKGSIEKILHPAPVEFSFPVAAVLAASILIKLWMALFNRNLGKRIDSQTLSATAADSRNDAISTTAVLVAALISHFTKWELDGYMGAAVAVFILYSGFGLIRETLDPILGKPPKPEFVEQIREKIMRYPGVLGTHDLIVHDYGPGCQFASVHVEVAAEADVIASHDVIDNIERDIRNELGLHLVIHMDPIVTADPEINDLRTWLSDAVKSIDPALSIHDLRVVRGPTHTNLIFDCVAPQNLSISKTELCKRIMALARERDPSFFCVITIDDSFAPIPH